MAKDLNNKKVIRLSESDLRNILKEAVIRTINESQLKEIVPIGTMIAGPKTANDLRNGKGFMGISFGIVKNQRNKQALLKYMNQYCVLFKKLETEGAELNRRIQLLQTANQKQVNEGVGGNVTKSFLKKGTKTAAKTTLRRTLNKVNKVAIPSAIGYAALDFFEIPRDLYMSLQKYKNNPGNIKPVDLLTDYAGLVQELKEICEKLENNPQILGADAIGNQNQFTSYEEYYPNVNSDNTSDSPGSGLFDLALSVGVSFVPIIGPIYDILDVAASMASIKANTEEEILQEVGKINQYLVATFQKIDNLFAQSKNKAQSMS